MGSVFLLFQPFPSFPWMLHHGALEIWGGAVHLTSGTILYADSSALADSPIRKMEQNPVGWCYFSLFGLLCTVSKKEIYEKWVLDVQSQWSLTPEHLTMLRPYQVQRPTFFLKTFSWFLIGPPFPRGGGNLTSKDCLNTELQTVCLLSLSQFRYKSVNTRCALRKL